MKFQIRTDQLARIITFNGEIEELEVERLDLDRFDTALMYDVSNDSNASAADYLLVLEMLFRREKERLIKKCQEVKEART